MSSPPRPGARPRPPQTEDRPARRVDDWARLRRFLVLGSADATYRAPRAAPTRAAVPVLERCLRADGARAVAEIVRVAGAGRAPDDDPVLFALAMAAGLGDERTRRIALDALPRVARTGTHLLRFATFVAGFRGWGRSLRRAVGAWYAAQPVEALARDVTGQRPCEPIAHRDLLRLAHPARRVAAGNPALAVTPAHERLFEWIVRGGTCDGLPRCVEGFARLQAARSPAETARLVAEYRLPRAAVRSDHLGSPAVWEALLPAMPVAHVLPRLATLTKLGVLTRRSPATRALTARLLDADDARVQPAALLAALRGYAAGRGVRGPRRWTPVPEVVDALDAAFHAALARQQPTGRRILLALDVSVSMAWGDVAGVRGLTPRDIAAVAALTTAATEPAHEIVGFSAGGWFRDRGRDRLAGVPDGLTRLPVARGQRLGDAIRTLDGLRFGGTDCALPIRYAHALEREVDTFVVYTDSDTAIGDVHPVQALRDYRRASGIDARLAVVGLVSSGFSIADPDDGGMLDVAGFDLATPRLVADFARGAF